MPLDIHVDADIQGLREAARFMHKLAGHAHDAGSEIHGVKADSAQDWQGRSGGAFRSFMGQFGGNADDMRDGAKKIAEGLDRHADAMNHVKQRMQQARDVCAKAGLQTTDKIIAEPGPAPAAPGNLPANATPEQTKAHAAATQAQSAHGAQAKAFNEATQTVGDARGKQKQAESYLNDLIGSDPVKKGLKVGNTVASFAGSAITTTSKYRADAAKMRANAAAWDKVRLNPNATLEEQVKGFTQRSISEAKATNYTAKATSTFARRELDKLPKLGKAAVGDLGQLGKIGGKVGKVADPILKRVPGIGLLATAAGVGYDISQGTSPTKAVVSGASSFAAGAATGEVVGAAFGGPVGVVAGGLVGAGVGYAVDHWDDITHGVGEATDWVGDKLGSLF